MNTRTVSYSIIRRRQVYRRPLLTLASATTSTEFVSCGDSSIEGADVVEVSGTSMLAGRPDSVAAAGAVSTKDGGRARPLRPPPAPTVSTAETWLGRVGGE